MRRLCGLLLVFASAAVAAEDGTLLFSFFRNNGEDGLYLAAASADGLQWRVLNGNKPLLQPTVGENKLMRDPSIVRGPDGVFHMVWTTAWRGKTIGYASSRDLKTWKDQKAFTVGNEDTLNCWAPEIFYDDAAREFVIVWASTIKGKFPETAGTGNNEYNHRLYAARTRDFVALSAPKLFYDPGFQVIDGAVFRDGKRWAMVAKNETLIPDAKYLFVTFADSLQGPWTKPSEPISGKQWAEGATPVRIGDAWYVYFDKYRDKHYGVIRSKDLRQWEDLTPQLKFPEGARHGTAFWAPSKIVKGLE
jgi:sucrose-6-phosphate hydrolase SacC (GH32 family)